jgi:hypothetical protein
VLRATFDPSRLLDGLTPENSDVVVTIGPATVISFPPVGGRGKLKSKRGRLWRYRLEATHAERDSCRLKIETVKGRMKLTADMIDLRGVRALGPKEVPFSLTVAGATFTKSIGMGEKEDRWKYRYHAGSRVEMDGRPGGAYIPEEEEEEEPEFPPPPPGPVTFRVLAAGGFSPEMAERTTVCRTTDAFDAEWPRYSTYLRMSKPAIDFTKEIVVIIDQGWFTGTGWYPEVTGVTEVGVGLRVDWVAWTPGNCPGLGAPSSPFVILAVTRRDGEVTFEKSTAAQSCF